MEASLSTLGPPGLQYYKTCWSVLNGEDDFIYSSNVRPQLNRTINFS